MAYAERSVFVLAKEEVTPGTEETPTGANAIRTATINEGINSELRDVQRNVGTLKSRRRILAGLSLQPSITCELAGSGAAGTAPDWGTFLKGCAMKAVANASAITGTAQAGGSTTTIQLAAAASGVDDAYNGHPIWLTAGQGYQAPPARNDKNLYQIVDYNGTTKVATLDHAAPAATNATTQYTIPACVVYSPTSSSLAFLTQHFYLKSNDGTKAWLLPGVRMTGNWQLTLQARQPGNFQFDFQGRLEAARSVLNASVPTPVLQDSSSLAWRAAITWVGGKSMCMTNFSVNGGNDITALECPNETWGIEGGAITAQNMSGSMNPRLADPDTLDVFSSLTDGTVYRFMTAYGTGNGNYVMVGISNLVFKGLNLARENNFINSQIEWDNEHDSNEGWVVAF